MEDLEQRPIGELVAENYRTATVFKKHKIDFCCQGGRTIDEACKKKGVSRWQLLNELEEAMLAPSSENHDFKLWTADLLCDYIEKKHHRYVQRRSAEIQPLLEKLCRVHGERHPELLKIKAHFKGAVAALTEHMKKEEEILFPVIREMVEAQIDNKPYSLNIGKEVENPIDMMREEHDTEGERFREIARLSNDYTPPADACNTYRVTFALLNEFEEDLHLHIHLENNILFPRAVLIANSFNA